MEAFFDIIGARLADAGLQTDLTPTSSYMMLLHFARNRHPPLNGFSQPSYLRIKEL
jgi:hypothetical protein